MQSATTPPNLPSLQNAPRGGKAAPAVSKRCGENEPLNQRPTGWPSSLDGSTPRSAARSRDRTCQRHSRDNQQVCLLFTAAGKLARTQLSLRFAPTAQTTLLGYQHVTTL